jgi:hypothetical protein
MIFTDEAARANVKVAAVAHHPTHDSMMTLVVEKIEIDNSWDEKGGKSTTRSDGVMTMVEVISISSKNE